MSVLSRSSTISRARAHAPPGKARPAARRPRSVAIDPVILRAFRLLCSNVQLLLPASSRPPQHQCSLPASTATRPCAFVVSLNPRSPAPPKSAAQPTLICVHVTIAHLSNRNRTNPTASTCPSSSPRFSNVAAIKPLPQPPLNRFKFNTPLHSSHPSLSQNFSHISFTILFSLGPTGWSCWLRPAQSCWRAASPHRPRATITNCHWAG